jgi:mRNA interferase MazF
VHALPLMIISLLMGIGNKAAMTSQIKDSGLKFHPHAGTMLMCNFKGMLAPEITKRRPVIVVTPRLAFRDGLAMVVPTSTTPPRHLQPFQVRLSRNYHPGEPDDLPIWAKCDLICSVSFERLDRFHIDNRKYFAPTISEEDLAAVRQGILNGLGFVNLTLNK